MSESSLTIAPAVAIFLDGWQTYQRNLIAALTPLTSEQLALRISPNLRSHEELARHIISTRAAWFHQVLDIGADEFAALAHDHPTTPRAAAQLVADLATTWRVMRAALIAYTPNDLLGSVTKERRGQPYTFTRAWVIWHVLEHDLHHGGELAYSLGVHGLAAPNI